MIPRPSISAIKCREAIGRLTPHGIQASRNTGWDREPGAPDAFLTTGNGQSWLVKIWQGVSLEPRLFEDPQAPASLEDTLAECQAWRERLRESSDQGAPGWIVLAPGLDDDAERRLGSEVVPVLSRHRCAKPERIAEFILAMKEGFRPDAGEATWWRAAAVPEVKIDPPEYARRRIERAPETTVAPLLLDYNQERCARLDLEPDEEIDRMSGDLSVRVITGVAGCGKTLVLLHRAALLARHFPKARVLIVSHNRPLIADLERRLRRGTASHPNIECRTFLGWLNGLAKPRGEPLPPHETRRWIERHRQGGAYPALEKRSDEWVADEIGWMFDHGHADESYLSAQRLGRGSGLQEPQRREILALAREYRAYLREAGLTDWSEWPLSVWEDRPGEGEARPRIDHLLIDEAQFFAPVWLELLRRTLRPGGHLFLCADPTQGFLRRRLSWSQIGIEVRNRSHRLARPYRSTRAILEFAGQFYRRRLPDDEEPLNLPSPEWLESIEPGRPPLLIETRGGEDQLRRLIEELKRFRQDGGDLADVLVLIGGRRLRTKVLAARLNRELGANSAANLKEESLPGTAAGVSHLMAATGLERPVVFLLGIDELAEEEGNPALGEEELREKVRDHTRQIYVGLTRAMERLVVFAGSRRLVDALSPPAEACPGEDSGAADAPNR